MEPAARHGYRACNIRKDKGNNGMAHDNDSASTLRSEWTEALEAQGIDGKTAGTLVGRLIDYLQRTRPGDTIYIPVRSRDYPVADIRAAIRAGDSIRAVCANFRLDRRTLYRLLDGGDDSD